MGAVNPFPNVSNHIDLYDRTLIFGEQSDLDWSPSDSQFSLDEAITNIRLEEPGKQPFHNDLGMESCFESSEHCSFLDAPRAWQMGSQDWHPKDCLPYDLKVSHNATARANWTPFDQEPSCSGVGSWSPHTSDSHSEVGGMLNQQQSSWECRRPSMTYIPFGGSPEFHTSGSYHCPPASAAVISPSELQHHQDDYLDAPSPRTNLQGIGAGQEYYPEDADLYHQQHGRPYLYCPKDEGIGSSIQSIKAESQAVSIKDEDDMDEDAEHDDDVDWSPKVEKYGHGRRLSRRSTASKNPHSAPKRTQTPKLATKQAQRSPRVEKKSYKNSVASHAAAIKANLQPCDQCSLAFPSDSQLKKHVLATHTRPFICTFHNYGCDSTVGSKNEWKRHINVQHMHLETWRCDIGGCAAPAGVPEDPQQNGRRISSHRVSSIVGQLDAEAANTHDFDRKDLFTQHMKRMHAPPQAASRAEKQAFEAGIEDAQKRCYRKLREPPANTICPFCPDHPVFETWDDRTEHVGKHLEKNDIDRTLEIEDPVLREWLREEDYLEWKGQGWKLKDTGKKKKRSQVKKEGEDDDDAEGDYE